jgi:hypothetical protein
MKNALTFRQGFSLWANTAQGHLAAKVGWKEEAVRKDKPIHKLCIN